MTLPRLWVFLAVALPALAAVIANLPSVDLTYHLRAGAQILDGGGIPTTDTWTFTAYGAPWMDQQWGAQVDPRRGLPRRRLDRSRDVPVGAHRADLRLPPDDLPAVAGWAPVARRCSRWRRSSCRPSPSGCVRSSSAWRSSPSSCCSSPIAARIPGRLWAIPFLMILWANVHGSFFLGPVVLGLAWLEDVHDHVPGARRLLVLAAVRSLRRASPRSGRRSGRYAIGLSTNPAVTARITEWQPTSLRSLPGIAFFLSAMAVVALIARRGNDDAVADACLAGRLLPDRRLRVARPRLVAARCGRRDRRRPRDRPGRRPGERRLDPAG